MQRRAEEDGLIQVDKVDKVDRVDKLTRGNSLCQLINPINLLTFKSYIFGGVPGL